ncbi:GntR family transcriptional regulator [Alkalicoccobacillus murimartini]|uniref:DNA-binding GntR family transcriptional regulator n=1 Tax=Alkalicoccobacillus murimartini TaxID=171685 RepID=A0ABT9YMC9_9BACI|nr:GntR family transcriptional regulator [Alkalicoccobacillus murimartini]MDQ0209015.1 DNA-binding GntR family transcriptional regulator [Alkalicoccobacillus murimartini]
MPDHSLQKPIPYYEQFYHSIKKMIFSGEFKPGDRINETQLAKSFNVSKSPVREAIRVLEREGLLYVDDKSKVRVYQPTQKDVREIYQCRQALEPFAVALTAELGSDSQFENLEQLLLDTAVAIEKEEPAEYIIKLNETFHQKLFTYCQNTRLQKQIEDLHSIIYLFRVYNFTGLDRAKAILSQHEIVYTFVKDRDSQRASEAMFNHLQSDLEHLLTILN